MASESVTKYVLEAGDLKRIQWMLLDAIRAKNELDLLKENIETGAREGYSAKTLLAVRPDPVDLDITEAAEMVQVLSALPVSTEV